MAGVCSACSSWLHNSLLLHARALEHDSNSSNEVGPWFVRLYSRPGRLAQHSKARSSAVLQQSLFTERVQPGEVGMGEYSTVVHTARRLWIEVQVSSTSSLQLLSGTLSSSVATALATGRTALVRTTSRFKNGAASTQKRTGPAISTQTTPVSYSNECVRVPVRRCVVKVPVGSGVSSGV